MIKLSKYFYIIVSIIFIVISCMTIDASIENFFVDKEIIEYVKQGVHKSSFSNIELYEVNTNGKVVDPVLNFDSNGYPSFVGVGDIFVTKESLLNIAPFISQFVSFQFGGHAGMMYDSRTVIETTGMAYHPEDNVVIESTNDLLKFYDDRAFVGLRVNATLEERQKAADHCLSLVGKAYNYSFVFNTKNKYYCTDLVQRSYSREAGLNFNLDFDGVAVSSNDLIVSKDTSIAFYRFIKDDKIYLYYSV